jgi:hypothetical protein
MSKYNRDAFEAWCESNNIETGRTVTVFEAWAKLQSERDELLDALKKFVRESVEVDVGGGDYVGTTCEALETARAAIKKAEAK